MKQIAIKVVGPLVAALVGVLGGAYVAYQQLEPRARIEERTEQAAETYADYLDAIARTTPLENTFTECRCSEGSRRGLRQCRDGCRRCCNRR